MKVDTALTFCLLVDTQVVVAKPSYDTEEELHSSLTSVAVQGQCFHHLEYCRTALIYNILEVGKSYYSLDLLSSSSFPMIRLLCSVYYQDFVRPSYRLVKDA